MPFTPTHVAAVLPVLGPARRAGLPASAAVVGSMVPDAGVFLPRVFDYAVTHSAAGLLTVCLPVGLAGFLAWEFALKAPLAGLCPGWVRRRVSAAPAGLSAGRLAGAAGLVVLGAASHVVWDAFTHPGWWGTRAVPALDRVAFTLPPGVPVRERAVPLHRALQHGSSVLLLPAMAAWAVWKLRRTPPGPAAAGLAGPARWVPLALLTAVPAGAAGFDLLRTFGHAPLRVTLARAVIAAGVTGGAALLLLAVAWAAGLRRAARGEPAPPAG